MFIWCVCVSPLHCHPGVHTVSKSCLFSASNLEMLQVATAFGSNAAGFAAVNAGLIGMTVKRRFDQGVRVERLFDPHDL